MQDLELESLLSEDELRELEGRPGKEQWYELDVDQLISEDTLQKLLNIKDGFEREQAITHCQNRARELKMLNDFKRNFKAYKIKIAQMTGSAGGKRTNFIDQPLEINCGEWIADNSGIRKNEFSINSGDVSMKFASPIPIMPTAIYENIDTGIEKIRLDFYKNDQWNHIICDRSRVASTTKIIDLADKGLEVNSENAKLLVKYIADCVSLNLHVLPRYKAVSRLGWVNDDFMPYDCEIKFDGEQQNKYLYDAVSQRGDFNEWVRFISPLRKNIYLRMQMAASFASPLIEKVNALPFILHLWGGTGAGKTVGMAVAASVWGNPAKGRMWRTLDNTVNYVCNLSAFMYSLPVALDELQTIKRRGETYDKLIMRCCEGTDRGRMTYDRANLTKTWECAYIFSGEEPITKANSGGGAKNRVIEVECTERVVSNGNEIIAFISENFGSAGMAYIDGIRQEKDLQDQYNEILKALLECDTTDKQAMAMSMILLGDKLACKYIFKDEAPLKIDDVKRFMATKKEVDAAERAYQFVVNLIARNYNRFDTQSPEIWGRIDDEYAFINKDILCRELANSGFEFEAVKAGWDEKKYLIKNTAGRFVHQTKCFGVKASYVKIALNCNDYNDEIDINSQPFQ